MSNLTVIPKGTILYRASPDTHIEKRYSSETRKTGVYFSTYMLQSLAMCIEYNKSMKLGVYELTKDIVCVNGKYSHFDLTPKKEDIKIFGVTLPLIKKKIYPSVNHFDKDIYCIIDLKYDYLRNFNLSSLCLKETDGEVFITEDLDTVILKEEFTIPLEGLLETIKKCNYLPNSQEYFNHLQKCNIGTRI